MNNKLNKTIVLGVSALVVTTGALYAVENEVSAEASSEGAAAAEYRSENAERSESVRFEGQVRGSASAEARSEGTGDRPDTPDVPDKPDTPDVPDETVHGPIDEVRAERDTVIDESRQTVGDLYEMSREERRQAIAEIRAERDEARQDVENIGDFLREKQQALMEQRREAIAELRRERAELHEFRREMVEEFRRERDELLDTQREARAEARVDVH